MRVLGSKVLVEGVEAAIEAGAGWSPLRHAMAVALSLPRVTVGKTRRDGDWDWTNRGLGKETSWIAGRSGSWQGCCFRSLDSCGKQLIGRWVGFCKWFISTGLDCVGCGGNMGRSRAGLG